MLTTDQRRRRGGGDLDGDVLLIPTLKNCAKIFLLPQFATLPLHSFQCVGPLQWLPRIQFSASTISLLFSEDIVKI